MHLGKLFHHMLIHLPTHSNEEWQEALDKLPEAVDNTYKEHPLSVRLFWADDRWHTM
jgi:hypothetical protein